MGNDYIVSWVADGTLFKVHSPTEFSSVIMKRYFRHDRYKSFLRQLSMYKFVRITEGPHRGAYGHPQFLKGRVELSRFIGRGDKLSLKDAADVAAGAATATTDSSGEKRHVTPSPSLPGPSLRALSSSMPCNKDVVAKNNVSHFDPLMKIGIAEIPSLGDWKVFNHYSIPVKEASGASTPADILDEIISTFGSSPCTATRESVNDFVNDFCWDGLLSA